MRKLRPGNVLCHTYYNGHIEYIRLIGKKKQRYAKDYSLKTFRTQVMWEVQEWDHKTHAWSERHGSFRGIQYLHDEYRELNKLERLVLFDEVV